MIPELGANRLALGKAAGITVEYSTDDGATWVDYGLTDEQKVSIFGTGHTIRIGKATAETITEHCQVRVTIDSDAFGVYTVLNKFVFYVSTSGSSNCWCTIDGSLEATPTVFKTFADKVRIDG